MFEKEILDWDARQQAKTIGEAGEQAGTSKREWNDNASGPSAA